MIKLLAHMWICDEQFECLFISRSLAVIPVRESRRVLFMGRKKTFKY